MGSKSGDYTVHICSEQGAKRATKHIKMGHRQVPRQFETIIGGDRVYQLAIYHSVLLFWKVKWKGKPERLLRRIKMAEDTVARLLITERIWSRTAERFFRKVEHLLAGVQRISEAKNVLRKWIKTNVPLSKQYEDGKISGA